MEKFISFKPRSAWSHIRRTHFEQTNEYGLSSAHHIICKSVMLKTINDGDDTGAGLQAKVDKPASLHVLDSHPLIT